MEVNASTNASRIEILPTPLVPMESTDESVIPGIIQDDDSDKAVAPSLEEEHAIETEPKTQAIFDIPEKYLQQSLATDPLVFSISAEQYNDIQDIYATCPLPNDILFPWLHGVDGRSYQQNLFFRIRRSLVPLHRGLLLVHADEAYPHHRRLVQSVLPSEILDITRTAFFQHEVEQGINLRNFKIQVARYATISDIVVYGAEAEQVAKQISQAQASLRAERMKELDHIKQTAGSRAIKNCNTLTYRTLVIKDGFDTFERQFPSLVQYSSDGLPIHCLNFLAQEREEMRIMTAATEVTPHIWLGNTQDVPVSARGADEMIESDADWNNLCDNPHRFSICIEAHDLADMPLPSILTLARENLDELDPNELPDEIIHLDVLSTGVPTETTSFDEFYACLMHLLAFMDDQATRGRNMLIHCSDGYTDTSLLALSWIMYKHKVRLPEAYLMLQEKRSFFVYAVDVMVLRRIEQRLRSIQTTSEHKRKRTELNPTDLQCHNQCKSTYTDNQLVQRLDVRIRDNVKTDLDDEDDDIEDGDEELDNEPDIQNGSSTIPEKRYHIRSFHSTTLDGESDIAKPVEGRPVPLLDCCYTQFNSNDIDESMPAQLLSSLMPLPPSDDDLARFPWFFSPRFEGSLPSKILPFLYLGNLNHATNSGILKALHITHVVSVGENANLSSDEFKLLLLDNLYDDGIDSIRGRMEEAMMFVDDARTNNTRCLIHCRVGVSRSAAITICYVMHYLHMSLIQAYLYVRARRLNVIIQPNLKFMYEMLQLEQRLRGYASISWPILCQAIHQLNISYRET
ncbi:protein-tyrosine phosphatase-like protein [Radiomyces spectabilis]|uniref:protein-tyrosine phosphatase-like protein n=1 Tax=Radiomyces spectabilis TaxID=64574 RepID=UPI00221EAE24|nr:protein-tyrosine phosphatase-like protein [Radiomyces spectabilis]KAI8388715.1 protein-tyrosine phosphatase-like protein [Radiomyces spectabilis]